MENATDAKRTASAGQAGPPADSEGGGPTRGGAPGAGEVWLTEAFEAARPHLRTVAYGMLGSHTEAEDAVQEAWFRIARGPTDGVRDLRAWLTTVVGRICLDMLRTRRSRREDYPGTWLPEPVVRSADADAYDPEHKAVEAEAIGLALLIVLETLTPPERLAFVLHDVFGMPFDEVADVVGRTPAAARQLASRARRRVQSAPRPDSDLTRQRRVVDAFLAAAREGNFEGLCAWLAPDAAFHLDLGPTTTPAPVVSGAEAVARQMLQGAKSFLPYSRPVLVNGAPGRLVGDPEHPIGVAGFTVAGDRIVRVDVIANPDKLMDIVLREMHDPDEADEPDEPDGRDAGSELARSADGSGSAAPITDAELREHLRIFHGRQDKQGSPDAHDAREAQIGDGIPGRPDTDRPTH